MGLFKGAALENFVEPYAEMLQLPHLPAHISTILRSFLFWCSLQLLSAGISPKLFPNAFAKMRARTKVQWDIHFVSLVHSSFIAPIGLYNFFYPDKNLDPFFGYTYQIGQMYAIAMGYFIWDIMISVRYEGLPFILHGLLSFIALALAFRPLLMVYGAVFVIWEASTPFLNIHWFLDKMGKTGTKAQFVNSLFLLASYMASRMVLGAVCAYNLVYHLCALALVLHDRRVFANAFELHVVL
ncbi:hypothetical protein MVES_002932 [Malassezia vespertilionis]|uniref:TLC domain-containing protein n=1 Tax=Malassezia vespertilionis TaxID=2020962 RepID=A0A2N1J9G8_9BASI|nr:hypothetical protein MVES_002932 [Malassezia vespertilionis]